MSVAYRTRTTFDYNEANERQAYERPADSRAAARRQTMLARRVLVLFVAIATAAVCIGLLYLKAQIFMVQNDINKTQKAIDSTIRTNSILQEQYSEAMDVNTIMDRAGRLGMGYPSQSQILYVDLSGSVNSVTMKK